MGDYESDNHLGDSQQEPEAGLPPRPPVEDGDPVPTFGDPSQWTDPPQSQEPQWEQPPQWSQQREKTDEERWDEFWNGTWKKDRERRKAGLPPEPHDDGFFSFGTFSTGDGEHKVSESRITLGFDPQAFVLFLVYLLPQIIWLFLPAPNDLLREVESVGLIESIAGGFSMISFLTMVTLVNVSYTNGKRSVRPDFKNPYAIIGILCMLGYLATWWLYYQGNASPVLFAFNVVLPLLAFVLHLFMRRNWVSLLPMTIFVVCQISSTFSTFVFR